jgi:hypothetical protein
MMLPRGFIRHPTEGDASFVAFAKLSARSGIEAHGETLAAVTFTHELGISTHHQNIDIARYPTFKEALNAFPVDQLEQDDIQIRNAHDFAEILWRLAVTVVAILNARPELLEPGKLLKVVKAKRHDAQPKEFWSPNFIGRLYRTQTIPSSENEVENDQDPKRTTPRAHWVRGFVRWQPHGPGRILRKLIWVNPYRPGAAK